MGDETWQADAFSPKPIEEDVAANESSAGGITHHSRTLRDMFAGNFCFPYVEGLGISSRGIRTYVSIHT